MCVRRSGGQLGVTGGSLEFHPPSWPYRHNERVTNSNAVVRGHWCTLGDVPYVGYVYAVVRSAMRSMALYQEGDGKQKEGAVLLGDG